MQWISKTWKKDTHTTFDLWVKKIIPGIAKTIQRLLAMFDWSTLQTEVKKTNQPQGLYLRERRLLEDVHPLGEHSSLQRTFQIILFYKLASKFFYNANHLNFTILTDINPSGGYYVRVPALRPAIFVIFSSICIWHQKPRTRSLQEPPRP